MKLKQFLNVDEIVQAQIVYGFLEMLVPCDSKLQTSHPLL